MSKINLPPITGGFNLSTINANFDKVEEALNNDVLYRDNPVGEPNQMINDLDMNGKRVYNLPYPTSNGEPIRLGDRDLLVGPQGPIGPPGAMGSQGVQGPRGFQGVQGVQGIQGVVGPTGPEGPQGADGRGVNILGSYNTLLELETAHPAGVAGEAYMVGPMLYVWVSGQGWTNVGNIQGPQGVQGPQGPSGPQGIQGIQGVEGPEGVQGIQGIPGEIPEEIFGPNGSELVGFIQSGAGSVTRTVQGKNRDIVSVKDFGAVGDGVTDDYPAFLAALATRKAIYVPKGTGAYRLGTALDVTNTVMFGDGVEASRIESVNSDVTKPVMYLGGNSCLRNLDIGFSPSVMTGVESAGQRPALILHSPSSGLPLQRGAAISNIRIRICGTGVYDPPSTGPSTYFSVTFDGIEISDFSYRGWDARSSIRTGNKYDNIYIGNAGGAYMSSSNVDCGFFLGGEESEAAFGQINVEWMRGGRAVSLTGIRAIAGGSFHIEQFTQINAYAAVVEISRSSGFIGSVTAYYCPINTVGWQLLKLGDSTYDGALANPTTCDYIRIGTLHVKGLNDGSQVTGGVGLTGLTDMAFAQREVSTVGPYALQIDNYVWNTYKADQAVYQNFPSDPHSRIRSIATLGGPPIGRGVVAGVNYVRRADGVIELTGAISVGAASSTTVVFPTIPGETVAGFPAACQFATVEPDDTGPSTYRYSAGVRSQTQFTVKSTAAGTITGFWRATGY